MEVHLNGQADVQVIGKARKTFLMSELSEKLWAILSERGCEAMGLSYMDAHQMMHELVREKISGLCVITDDAARRALRTENLQSRKSNPNGSRPVVRKS